MSLWISIPLDEPFIMLVGFPLSLFQMINSPIKLFLRKLINLLGSLHYKVKVILCKRTPGLLVSPSLITFQYHSLVVSLLENAERAGTCFHVVYTPHSALNPIKTGWGAFFARGPNFF